MNLIGDAWIPVFYNNGEKKLVSLNQLYKESELIADLVATPPQRIALMRLILCITQAALDGPADEEEWISAKGRIIKESLEYLNQWYERFELYGEHPFLQVRDIEKKDNATLDKLDFGLAAGNNTVLFDHQASLEGRDHPHSWRVLMLLTYQCFSPGGTIGEVQWNNYNTGKNSEHAPCIESSPLHLLIKGQNLLETLHFNLISKDQIKDLPNGKWGKPIWENFPKNPNPEENQGILDSYLGRMVPLSRAILLNQSNQFLTLSNGLSYPKLPIARETMLTVIKANPVNKSKISEKYLSIDLNKHPWRSIESLLSIDRKNSALALQNLKYITGKTIEIWVGGLSADKGKIIDTAEWIISIPKDLLGKTQFERILKCINFADIINMRLLQAVEDYYFNNNDNIAKKNKKDPSFKKIKGKASTTYWSKLDANYNLMFKENENDSTNSNSSKWNKFVVASAYHAYDKACPNQTPRQIQAYITGKKRFEHKKFAHK